MPEDLGIQPGFIDRDQLSLFLPNPRAVDAFEGLQRRALVVTPAAVDLAQGTADDAALAAAAAQASSDLIAAAAFVVLAGSGALSNERVLTGGVGVTLDVATASLVKIVVNALGILNTAPVVLTQPLKAPTLELTATTPSASVTAASHALPIVLNGTTYYLKLSATP